jgi:maltooligosyltrehalose trehalohydrolase
MLYQFRINGSDKLYPDPASRFQPDGPHGASTIVDPTAFQWTDRDWRGRDIKGQIMYELHVGTFTPQGTWQAAAEKLPLLVEDGITVIEMMPVADFPGRFGWGYDGVNMFAPTHLYGTPDDLRSFIDRAHSLNLAVILDVVYNHFGPDGNYLGEFSDHYINRERVNEWGDSINFDGAHSGPVREFFITNGRYWIEEFHFDGFRFDATQSIHDKSDEYIVGAIGRAARTAAPGRNLILVAENESQETKLARSKEEGGDDLNGIWNDDWHHSSVVALTGRNEAYYTDYRGSPQEFISAAKYGYLYQGQPYQWQEAPRGYPAFDISPEAFVCFLENHDQVSNSAFGERLRLQTSPGRYRALTTLLLLAPSTPLLFQGQEFGATSPFVFFSEVGDEQLQKAVRSGRMEFLSQFPSAAGPESQKRIVSPNDIKSFDICKLDWSERERCPALRRLHQDLIRLRHEDSRLSLQIPGGVDGAVLGNECFVLRFFGEQNDDRLLIVNLGRRLEFHPCSDPLLAPPLDHKWESLWSSEHPIYGGPGMVESDTDREWIVPAEAAYVLTPRRRAKPRKKPKKR